MPTTKRRTKKSSNGKSVDQIYQEVTDSIVASLEEGTIPWDRPWETAGLHRNLNSKRPYRGINQFLLDIVSMKNGYSQPYWVTYKGAEKLGGHVKKDEKSTIVVFWKILRFKAEDDEGNDAIKTVPLLKYFRVFNVEQCEGLDDKIPTPAEEREFTPIEQAQAIIDGWDDCPDITHAGDRAYYAPIEDKITLPSKKQFKSEEGYYTTAYHEMVHSTGHKDRLGRIKDWTRFGSDPYAKEELVAEMGAAMLAGVAEVDVAPIRKNTKAYIQSWIKRFKEDKKLLVSAASQAQKAADTILNVKWEDNSDE